MDTTTDYLTHAAHMQVGSIMSHMMYVKFTSVTIDKLITCGWLVVGIVKLTAGTIVLPHPSMEKDWYCTRAIPLA